MKRQCLAGLLAVLLGLTVTEVIAQTQQEAYPSWPAQQTEKIGKGTRLDGRVGGRFDMRVIRSERS